MTLRFLTYNIHKGIGSDRKFNLDRILEILKDSKADVICLQEVDKDVPRSKHIHIAKQLGTQLGFYYRFEENVILKNGSYGNATLSRYPIVSSENLDLTWKIKKKRGVLITKIELEPSRTMMVYNCHLGLAAFERTWQVHKFLTSQIHKSHKSSPIVILGDTNDGRHKLEPLMEIAGFTDSCTTRRKRRNFTFPAYAPVVRIDKIFYNDKWISHHHKVLHSQLSKTASDHSPVTVDLELIAEN